MVTANVEANQMAPNSDPARAAMNPSTSRVTVTVGSTRQSVGSCGHLAQSTA